jgi:hypothetical protein
MKVLLDNMPYPPVAAALMGCRWVRIIGETGVDVNRVSEVYQLS